MYTVTVTSERNCMDTLSLDIGQPEPIQIDFEVEAATSGQANGSARAIVSGGTAPYDYIWNTSPIQTGAFAINLAAGLYEVFVIDQNSCRGSDTVRVDGLTHSEGARQENPITLWPNPGSHRFYLKLSPGGPIPHEIQLRDNLGRIQRSKDWPHRQRQSFIEPLSSGLYYIHVLYHNGTQKVIPVIVQQ